MNGLCDHCERESLYVRTINGKLEEVCDVCRLRDVMSKPLE